MFNRGLLETASMGDGFRIRSTHPTGHGDGMGLWGRVEQGDARSTIHRIIIGRDCRMG